VLVVIGDVLAIFFCELVSCHYFASFSVDHNLWVRILIRRGARIVAACWSGL